MKRPLILASCLALAVAAALVAPAVTAQEQEPPKYTPAEYNAYKACADDKVAASRVKCLDDFVAKFPESDLIPYPYADLLFLNAYNELRNWPKVIQYADKILALGSKIDANTRLQIIYPRTVAFASLTDAAAQAREADRARTLAEEGLAGLQKLAKPDTATQDQWDAQLKPLKTLFTGVIAQASFVLKDYPAAIEGYRASLALNPTEGPTHYRLALSYLQKDPPSYQEGMWELGRALALKIGGEAQVRNYLKAQMQRYQQTACEREIDAQVNELVALATASPSRPPDYRIPSADDLAAARGNAAQFIQVLQSGGDQARVMWLAMCNAEFPELYGKVIETAQGNDSVILKLYTGTTEEEIEAATAPNTEVKVVEQPDAKRLQKDNWLRYSGTLASYTPDPFVLHFDRAKVNPEDIPEERATGPAKRPKRPTKRPSR